MNLRLSGWQRLGIVASLLVFTLGCNKPNRRRVLLVSDTQWPIGEAKWCSLDGRWNEMHCFPPARASAPAEAWHGYLVDADFDKPVRFDKDQWAYDFVCRLDSAEYATCELQGK